MPAYRENSKLFVVDRIRRQVPKELLQRQVSEELFQRDYTQIGETIRKYRKNTINVKRHL